MTKRRRQGWMLFLAGLLLLAGAWLLLKLLPGLDTTPWRAVPFLCLGVGCGLFGGGTGELLAVQAMKKHPELQKQNEIAERDERNVAIRSRAQAVSGEVLQWGVMAAAWLSIGLGAMLWVTLAAVGVFLAKSVLELCLMARYQREM